MKGGGTAFRGVVLVGFMGAGKSSVGKVLAERLEAEFVDVDDRVERSAGRSIGEIFATEGEKAFRGMEKAAIREALSVSRRVVAVGGGAFLDEENRRLLKAYAPVAFLDVSWDSVIARLSGDRSRPLFPGGKEEGKLRDLMERRRPAYQEADFTVSTDNRPVSEVADAVSDLLARETCRGREGEGG
jgi:shikimate kinase